MTEWGAEAQRGDKLANITGRSKAELGLLTARPGLAVSSRVREVQPEGRVWGSRVWGYLHLGFQAGSAIWGRIILIILLLATHSGPGDLRGISGAWGQLELEGFRPLTWNHLSGWAAALRFI